jgi:MerR family transcriptional regulator, light-induced transcriptional regulator
MTAADRNKRVSTPAAHTDDAPRYRSGAVARMAQMPVATLRVWERRYRVTTPEVTASGQRLYTAADVHRLALIRELTELGHAIGAIAPLDLAQLQAVAATHFNAAGHTTGAVPRGLPSVRSRQALRVAVVGTDLARRLGQPALLRQLGMGLQAIGPFDSLAQAARAVEQTPVDLLLVHAPTLQPGWLATFDAAAPGLRALPTALFFGFAADTTCAALARAGMALLREPQNDTVLGQWLHSLASRTASAPVRPDTTPAAAIAATPPHRRWDDATVSRFAAMASTVACECPRHIAELLLQLVRFEAYSAECESRNTADAELHAYLGQLAGAARAQFETALARVACAEGWPLPPG